MYVKNRQNENSCKNLGESLSVRCCELARDQEQKGHCRRTYLFFIFVALVRRCGTPRPAATSQSRLSRLRSALTTALPRRSKPLTAGTIIGDDDSDYSGGDNYIAPLISMPNFTLPEPPPALAQLVAPPAPVPTIVQGTYASDTSQPSRPAASQQHVVGEGMAAARRFLGARAPRMFADNGSPVTAALREPAPTAAEPPRTDEIAPSASALDEASLFGMGFEEGVVHAALADSGGDADAALERLLQLSARLAEVEARARAPGHGASAVASQTNDGERPRGPSALARWAHPESASARASTAEGAAQAEPDVASVVGHVLAPDRPAMPIGTPVYHIADGASAGSASSAVADAAVAAIAVEVSEVAGAIAVEVPAAEAVVSPLPASSTAAATSLSVGQHVGQGPPTWPPSDDVRSRPPLPSLGQQSATPPPSVDQRSPSSPPSLVGITALLERELNLHGLPLLRVVASACELLEVEQVLPCPPHSSSALPSSSSLDPPLLTLLRPSPPHPPLTIPSSPFLGPPLLTLPRPSSPSLGLSPPPNLPLRPCRSRWAPPCSVRHAAGTPSARHRSRQPPPPLASLPPLASPPLVSLVAPSPSIT